MSQDLFDKMADSLERTTSFDRLEARGTLRLALKEAGLDAAGVTGSQIAVVMRKVMPKELETRGIADATPICESIAREAEAIVPEDGARGDSPEAVFERLGG